MCPPCLIFLIGLDNSPSLLTLPFEKKVIRTDDKRTAGQPDGQTDGRQGGRLDGRTTRLQNASGRRRTGAWKTLQIPGDEESIDLKI